MRTRLRLLPLLAAVSIGAVAVAGPAAADPAASSTSAAPTSAAPTTSAGPTSSAPTSAPAPTSTAAPTTTEAPVPTADPVPVALTPEAAPTSAPVAAAPSTSSPRPTPRTTTTTTAGTALPVQPTTGGSAEATTATALAAGAASAALDAAQSAAQAEAGQLLVQTYVTRANRVAVIDLSSPVDVVAAALAEARTLEQLVADQTGAVEASLTDAQESRAAAVAALDQVLALPQTAAGVAEQTSFAQQVVTAAGISVDRAAAALAAVQEAAAPVQDAVATLSVRADRVDPASSATPLPDATAVYALGAVVVLGFGVAGTTALSARRATVRRRVAAVRAGMV